MVHFAAGRGVRVIGFGRAACVRRAQISKTKPNFPHVAVPPRPLDQPRRQATQKLKPNPIPPVDRHPAEAASHGYEFETKPNFPPFLRAPLPPSHTASRAQKSKPNPIPRGDANFLLRVVGRNW